MLSFIVGVAASLTAVVLVAVYSRWCKSQWLRVLSASRLLGHGVECVYRSQREAEADMKADFERSATVSVMCLRGYSLVDADRPFRFLLDDDQKRVQLLLSDPGDHFGDNQEILVRGQEYPGADSASYREHVHIAVSSVITAMAQHRRLECRLHREPAVFRIFLSDSKCYLGFYRAFEPSTEGGLLCATRRSPLYDGMRLYFDRVWERSRRVEALEYHDRLGSDRPRHSSSQESPREDEDGEAVEEG